MNLSWSTAVLAAALVVPVARAADLQITVNNGPAAPVTLYVALFDSADAMSADRPLAAKSVPMRSGNAQLVFTGLQPGRYALRSFADENANGKLDTNFLGIPSERYGFSNDAQGRMGPPAFDAAAVPVQADTAIVFRLR